MPEHRKGQKANDGCGAEEDDITVSQAPGFLLSWGKLRVCVLPVEGAGHRQSGGGMALVQYGMVTRCLRNLGTMERHAD